MWLSTSCLCRGGSEKSHFLARTINTVLERNSHKGMWLLGAVNEARFPGDDVVLQLESGRWKWCASLLLGSMTNGGQSAVMTRRRIALMSALAASWLCDTVSSLRALQWWSFRVDCERSALEVPVRCMLRLVFVDGFEKDCLEGITLSVSWAWKQRQHIPIEFTRLLLWSRRTWRLRFPFARSKITESNQKPESRTSTPVLRLTEGNEKRKKDGRNLSFIFVSFFTVVSTMWFLRRQTSSRVKIALPDRWLLVALKMFNA